MRNFKFSRCILKDEDAISSIIGSLLMLAIFTSIIVFVQTKFVPIWNAETENEHFRDVYQDMMNLPSVIERTTLVKVPQTDTIRMGLTYPARPPFYNPSLVLFGSFEVVSNNWINVSYTKGSNTITKNYRSSSLKYKLSGNHPMIVYEHGIIIKDYSAFNKGNITQSPNTIIDDADIYIPILLLNNSQGYSKNSVEPITLAFYPVKYEDNPKQKPFTTVDIEMNTQYPDVWKKLLKSTSQNIAVTINSNKIYISSNTGNEITLPDETIQLMQSDRLYSGQIQI